LSRRPRESPCRTCPIGVGEASGLSDGGPGEGGGHSDGDEEPDGDGEIEGDGDGEPDGVGESDGEGDAGIVGDGVGHEEADGEALPVTPVCVGSGEGAAVAVDGDSCAAAGRAKGTPPTVRTASNTKNRTDRRSGIPSRHLARPCPERRRTGPDHPPPSGVVPRRVSLRTCSRDRGRSRGDEARGDRIRSSAGSV
jgi:hypothetical protein